MKKINPKQEWKILDYELIHNKPPDGPYPEDVVKRRELLLLAQNLLADYEFTKSDKEKIFFGEMYKKTMESYFNWNIE